MFPREGQLVLIIYIFQPYLFSLRIQSSELKPLLQANFGINTIFVHSFGRSFASGKLKYVKPDFPLIHFKIPDIIFHAVVLIACILWVLFIYLGVLHH